MITPPPSHASGNDSVSVSAPCKNHPSVPSGYFAADQPWAKYCRQCALNVALSGRRIEKELSGVQFEQKMRIGSAASELRSSLGVIEQTSEHYRRLAERTEEAAAHLQGYLKQVESALRELTLVKEKLEGVYSREFAERVQVYYERQSHAALLSLQIKREVQAIESNFGTLIEAQKEVFAEQQQRWDSLLQSFRQNSLSQEDYRQGQQKIGSSIEEFYTQLQKIACFRIDLKVERPNSTQEELDMTLTPIDGNSLAETITFEQLKLSMKPRGQLRLKTHKRLGESFSSSKACTKRSSLCDHQTIRRA